MSRRKIEKSPIHSFAFSSADLRARGSDFVGCRKSPRLWRMNLTRGKLSPGSEQVEERLGRLRRSFLRRRVGFDYRLRPRITLNPLRAVRCGGWPNGYSGSGTPVVGMNSLRGNEAL